MGDHLNDRGLMKWRSAAFLPEHGQMLREMQRDLMRTKKPVLDDYQLAEFEERILTAMEFSYFISVDLWEDGFISACVGRIVRLDEINKIIYLEDEDGLLTKIRWANITNVILLD